VKAEAVRLVAAHLGEAGDGEDLADLVEEPGEGGGAGARRFAERFLIDLEHLVELIEAVDAVVRPGGRRQQAEVSAGGVTEDVAAERAFARPADAGETGPAAQREGGVDVLEVVMACAADRQPVTGGRARLLPSRYSLPNRFNATISFAQRLGGSLA